MVKVRCPICQKVMELRQRSDWPSFPFCSRRCKTIDLGRWLGEGYGVPPPADAGEDDGTNTEEALP